MPARAAVLRRGGAGDAARRVAQAGGRRDHGRRSISRSCSASSAAATTCSASASACRSCSARGSRCRSGRCRSCRRFGLTVARRLGADECLSDAIVIGGGCAGFSRRHRAGRIRRARAGRRSAARAWRPRHGVHRSGNRRARRQRPAHPDGVLRRDARVPRSHRRRRSRALAERAEGADDRSRAAITACWRCRRCRRRCTFLPACWPGTRSAGASDLSVLRIGVAISRGPPRAATPLRRDRLGLSVRAWLEQNGQAPRLCELFWEPLALAALNQSIDQAEASHFIRVLERVFGPDPAAAALVLPAVPLDELYAEPARAWLDASRQRGARQRSGKGGDRRQRVRGVRVRDELIEAPLVISTVPWHAFHALFDQSPAGLEETIANATALASLPIVTVNLWFDRAVMHEPLVGLPGRNFQWVFDRRAIVGGDASHLSLISSGAEAIVAQTNDELTAMALGEVREALPAARSATLRKSLAVREKRSTFSLAPDAPPRPQTRDGDRRIAAGRRLDRHGIAGDDRVGRDVRSPGARRRSPRHDLRPRPLLGGRAQGQEPLVVRRPAGPQPSRRAGRPARQGSPDADRPHRDRARPGRRRCRKCAIGCRASSASRNYSVATHVPLDFEGMADAIVSQLPPQGIGRTAFACSCAAPIRSSRRRRPSWRAISARACGTRAAGRSISITPTW